MNAVPVPVCDAVSRFLDDLIHAQQRSPRTVALYGRMLAPWRELDKPTNSLTLEDCETLIRMRRPPSSPVVCSALNGFFRYSKQMKWVQRSPMRDFEPSGQPPSKPASLSEHELKRLWAVVTVSRRRPRENQLMLLLLMHGFTSSELVTLKWDDLDLEKGLTHSITTRGKYKRTIALHPLAVNLLMSREPVEARIFRCSSSALRDRVQRWGRQAGIPMLSPYQFRHTLTRSWIDQFQDADGLPSRARWPIDRQRALDHASKLLEPGHP
jgi:integrase